MAVSGSPTVLIVSAEQTRALSVNPRLLFIIKPLLAGLVLAVTVLGAGLAALGIRYWSERQQMQAATYELQQKVVDLQNYTSAEINAKLEALRKSEQVVSDLQNYLKERGVYIKPVAIEPQPGKRTPSAGGPVLSTAVRTLPFTEGFSENAETLLQALQRTPLGAPHTGPLTSHFGNRSNPFSGRGAEDHGGLDIKGQTGDPVRATANGKVSFAGVQGGYGNVVRIAHGNGYETVFGHLSKINVQTGKTIRAGEVLGLVGSTGRSTGPHLHYEVLRGGERLNPEQFLSLDAPSVATGG